MLKQRRTSVWFLLIAAVVVASGCALAKDHLSHDYNISITAPDAVNINTADKDELMRVPFIGERTADEIIAFRETNGRFRRPEQLMQIRGISDRRFRQIRHLVRIQ